MQSTLALTGPGWADHSKANYYAAASRAVVGTERRRPGTWVYDYEKEVDRIFAEKKTKELGLQHSQKRLHCVEGCLVE